MHKQVLHRDFNYFHAPLQNKKPGLHHYGVNFELILASTEKQIAYFFLFYFNFFYVFCYIHSFKASIHCGSTMTFLSDYSDHRKYDCSRPRDCLREQILGR